MPDYAMPSNAAPSSQPNPPPHIAQSTPMEMSAPIQEISNAQPNVGPAAQLSRTSPAVLPTNPSPLSENAAPFNNVDSSQPGVEYVQFAPTAPATQAPPRPVIAAPTRSNIVTEPVRSPVFQSPPPPVPAPQPVAPVMSPPPPVIMETGTPSVSSSVSPYSSPQASKIYSFNSREVWRVRSSTRRIYTFVATLVTIVLTAMVIYWLSIGTPTNLGDIPLVRRLLK